MSAPSGDIGHPGDDPHTTCAGRQGAVERTRPAMTNPTPTPPASSPAPDVGGHRDRLVALVLGAGGSAGHAFHTGVLAALADHAGWDARDAELIIGTSAGSGVSALLRGGLSPADIYAHQRGRPLSAEGDEVVARLPRAPGTAASSGPVVPSRRRSVWHCGAWRIGRPDPASASRASHPEVLAAPNRSETAMARCIPAGPTGPSGWWRCG